MCFNWICAGNSKFYHKHVHITMRRVLWMIKHTPKGKTLYVDFRRLTFFWQHVRHLWKCFLYKKGADALKQFNKSVDTVALYMEAVSDSFTRLDKLAGIISEAVHSDKICELDSCRRMLSGLKALELGDIHQSSVDSDHYIWPMWKTY